MLRTIFILLKPLFFLYAIIAANIDIFLSRTRGFRRKKSAAEWNKLKCHATVSSGEQTHSPHNPSGNLCCTRQNEREKPYYGFLTSSYTITVTGCDFHFQLPTFEMSRKWISTNLFAPTNKSFSQLSKGFRLFKFVSHFFSPATLHLEILMLAESAMCTVKGESFLKGKEKEKGFMDTPEWKRVLYAKRR